MYSFSPHPPSSIYLEGAIVCRSDEYIAWVGLMLLFFSARNAVLWRLEVQIFTVRLFTLTLLQHLMESDLTWVFPSCFIELLSSLFKYIHFTALPLRSAFYIQNMILYITYRLQIVFILLAYLVSTDLVYIDWMMQVTWLTFNSQQECPRFDSTLEHFCVKSACSSLVDTAAFPHSPEVMQVRWILIARMFECV